MDAVYYELDKNPFDNFLEAALIDIFMLTMDQTIMHNLKGDTVTQFFC